MDVRAPPRRRQSGLMPASRTSRPHFSVSAARKAANSAGVLGAVSTLSPAPGLQTFPLPVDVAGWTIVMLWPAAARGDPGAGWFREVVRRAAAEAAR